MARILRLGTICLLVCATLAGCKANVHVGSPPSVSGASVVLAMTDSPPTGVTVLSAKVTLTGATLSPGNVSILPAAPAATTVDLVRLQTNVAYIATATNIAEGNYTAVTLTFANPMLTFENDTNNAMGSRCPVGAICTVTPAAVSLSATVPLSSFTVAANTTMGVLIDVNLNNLLNGTLGEDFGAGTSVTQFTPGGSNAPPVGAEDIVGQVGTVNSSSNTFTLTNATGSYSLRVDGTSSFFQFPSGACTFSCLNAGQILSVDIAMQPDGTTLARNITFEDSASTEAEIEGVISNTTNIGSQEFDIVIQSMSSSIPGLAIGQDITVQYSITPPTSTSFDIDLVHIDNVQASTSGFLFAKPSDLAVGQQVSILRNGSSTNSLLKADRVRLRSTQITTTVQSVGLPNINLTPPFLISGHSGVTTVTAQTSTFPPTIYFEIGTTINPSAIASADIVSVRGPLFNVSGARTMLTTKVVLKEP
jgi:hypothetical protein